MRADDGPRCLECEFVYMSGQVVNSNTTGEMWSISVKFDL